MANILGGMKENGVRRLIVLGAAGVFLDGIANQSWVNRLGFRIVRSTLLKYPFLDQASQERRLQLSEVDFTIVRPTRLTNRPRSGRYRISADRLPPAAKAIPRADVAEFMLKQLNDDRFIRRGVYIAR
jgi:putative NADH-flavin reductase